MPEWAHSIYFYIGARMEARAARTVAQGVRPRGCSYNGIYLSEGTHV